MGNEAQVSTILHELLKVESIEEAFACVIVHNLENEEKKNKEIQNKLSNFMSTIPKWQQETQIRQYLLIAADVIHHKKLKLCLSMLEDLVETNVISAKLLCDSILNCEKMQYQNELFWIEGFELIRNIIGGVDYKGVRGIMRACKEKAHSLPTMLDVSVQPQMNILKNVIEYIFDRNACLIPSYLIVSELEKCAEQIWPHWLAKLISNYRDSYRNVVQMVSIIGRSKMLPIVEHTAYNDSLINPWALDRDTLTFINLKGNLPYDPDLTKPQTNLLKYVLEQPYSRDMVLSMLRLPKVNNSNRCIVLEEQFIDLIIRKMEKLESEPVLNAGNQAVNRLFWPWLHVSAQLIHCCIFQYVNFSKFILALQERLTGREWKKSRDSLMWVLLQYISGTIQRNNINNYLPFFSLYNTLYPEKTPLPAPDCRNLKSIYDMAAISIYIHLLRKINGDRNFIPPNLRSQYEFLENSLAQTSFPLDSDYRIVLILNAYSTNVPNTPNEYFNRAMTALFDSISKSQTQQSMLSLQSNSSIVNEPTTPLSMFVLDSLTVHVKMTLIQHILMFMMKSAQSKSSVSLPPALVETYSRLLVYAEIENLGIKNFINNLLPTIFKAHAWGTLYTLLDMFSYRMHHINLHYRVQILSHLHNLASGPQTNQTQLHLCVESSALRLITSLGSTEVQCHLSRFSSEPKTIISTDSEELNRALVLTLARSMQITGTGSVEVCDTWSKDLLNTIMLNTPHSWADHTLQCFPPTLREFFQQNRIKKEDKQQIKKSVEEEYRNWASMSNENDIIAHFSVSGSPPLFLCLLWKMIIETDRINPIAYKILERIGARAVSAHLRKFCDYIVYELTSLNCDASYVSKSVDAINDMIWKYNIVTFDRLMLCLVLRTLEGNEAQICFYIIQLLLLKASEFRSRVQEFVKENSPDHWNQSNWHEKHIAFHKKFPEKFAPEGFMEPSSGGPHQSQQYPVYFGNVCLRFLPVFDIVVHRCLEISQVSKILEILLDHLGCLYRFHDRPITYLYNTLYYYEKKLRDQPMLKRRLVTAILESLKEIIAPGWGLTEAYQNISSNSERSNSSDEDKKEQIHWQPSLEYYVKLVQRLVDTISGSIKFPPTDWRFNEFPNPAAHTLYITCVELMALPVAPNVVTNNLLDVVVKGCTIIPCDEIHAWVNSVGIIISALPECYWSIFQDRLVQVLTSPELIDWQYHNLTPFQLFNFKLTHNSFFENKFSYMLALAHSIWQHAGFGQTLTLAQFVKERLQPVVKTEEQLVYACHLIGSMLNRVHIIRPKSISDVTLILYEMLEKVNNEVEHMNYMDPICDLLYHIKYMYLGNLMKNEIDAIIKRLKLPLQMRLRFITYVNPEENQSS